MRELSQPYADPQQARKMQSDWLVVERTGDLVEVHRFTDEASATAWLDERLASPEQERELDERCIEALC